MRAKPEFLIVYTNPESKAESSMIRRTTSSLTRYARDERYKIYKVSREVTLDYYRTPTEQNENNRTII